MLKKSFSLIALLIFIFTSLGLSQDSPALVVEELSVCASIEDRQPAGIDTVFSNDIGKLYCFTKISGAEDTTTVSHIWYYNDQEMAKLDLNVKSKAWRTWSSKNIIEYWVGDWRVDVTDAQGQVIGSTKFTIKAVTQE